MRFLHLEDSPAEAKLVSFTLAEAGIDCQIDRVDTREAYEAALARSCYSLILADFSLPQFDGESALASAQKMCGDVPFVIVSGAVGEEKAVNLLKAGATDFVLKQHLDRLPPAVRRALREAHDRADKLRREQELKDARDAAEAASRAKDHFLAVLSHELRTPLAPILTTAQLMEEDTELPQRARDAFRMIRRNVALEARLIDDLLDITRITRGKLELQLADIDLHEKIRHVMEIVHADLRANQLAVSLDLSAINSRLRGDPARLQQVLWNLIKNAVKFTPVGGTITITTTNPHPGELRVSVIDTGVGIDAEALPRLFHAFEQGGRDVTRLFGGLGLGLAISKALVDAHQGKLVARSEGRGKGATFTVTLPAGLYRTAEPAAAAPAIPAGAGAKQAHILLVEDHPDTARAMNLVLNRGGFHVRVAGSIAEALRAADAESFDLVISDLGLPDGSGLDLMRQLVTKAGRPIKGIAVSGYGMEEDVRQSRAAGFTEHVVKPINLQQLQTVVKRVLGA